MTGEGRGIFRVAMASALLVVPLAASAGQASPPGGGCLIASDSRDDGNTLPSGVPGQFVPDPSTDILELRVGQSSNSLNVTIRVASLNDPIPTSDRTYLTQFSVRGNTWQTMVDHSPSGNAYHVWRFESEGSGIAPHAAAHDMVSGRYDTTHGFVTIAIPQRLLAKAPARTGTTLGSFVARTGRQIGTVVYDIDATDDSFYRWGACKL